MKFNFLFVAILLIIFLLGVYLRLVNLDKNPNGLYVDEASTGYNAWSILETGKDEYGKSFPLAFRFLGSYTPPLYTYMTVIPVKVFGLSVTSTRLVSAISGIILMLVFLLFLKSFNLSKDKVILIFGLLFLAISPWAIFYSRIGYEINLAFLIYSLGVYFLWLGLKNMKHLVLGLGLLALSMSAYHSEKLLVPLTLITYFFLFKNLLFKKRTKSIFWGIIVFLFFLVPQLLIFFTPASTIRGTGLFYSHAIIEQAGRSVFPGFISIPLSAIREFSSQYFAYFSPRNLFFQPDPDLQRSLPELSTYYPWMVVLYLFGLFEVIKVRKTNVGKFTLLLFLLAPIPASLAGDPFSTQRALPLLLPLTIILILGLQKILNNKYRLLVITLVLVLSIFSLISLYRSLAVLLPNERAKTWGYGYEQLTEEIKKNPKENFVIDTSRIKPAYIEIAFYMKYPPDKLQASVNPVIKTNYYKNTSWDSYYHFANIETREINWENDIYKNQILVGDELAISDNQIKEHFLNPVFEIKAPDKKIIFKGYRTNPSEKCKYSKSINCESL